MQLTNIKSNLIDATTAVTDSTKLSIDSFIQKRNEDKKVTYFNILKYGVVMSMFGVALIAPIVVYSISIVYWPEWSYNFIWLIFLCSFLIGNLLVAVGFVIATTVPMDEVDIDILISSHSKLALLSLQFYVSQNLIASIVPPYISVLTCIMLIKTGISMFTGIGFKIYAKFVCAALLFLLYTITCSCLFYGINFELFLKLPYKYRSHLQKAITR